MYLCGDTGRWHKEVCYSVVALSDCDALTDLICVLGLELSTAVYAAPPPPVGVAMVQMPGQIGISQPYGLDVQITNQTGQTVAYGQQPGVAGVVGPAQPYFSPQQQTLFGPTYAQPPMPMGYGGAQYPMGWQPYAYPTGVSGSSGPYGMVYSQPPNPYLQQSQGFGQPPFGSVPSSANQPPSGGANGLLLPQYINSPPNGPGARVPAAANGTVGTGGAAGGGGSGGAAAAGGNRSGGAGGGAAPAGGGGDEYVLNRCGVRCAAVMCLLPLIGVDVMVVGWWSLAGGWWLGVGILTVTTGVVYSFVSRVCAPVYTHFLNAHNTTTTTPERFSFCLVCLSVSLSAVCVLNK